jgi:hypothetical protein
LDEKEMKLVVDGGKQRFKHGETWVANAFDE